MTKSLSAKQLLPLLLVSTLLLFSCSPKNKTAPVQFDYNETVGCLVTNDFYAVFFSAYFRPEGNLEDIKGKDRNKLLRSYCKDIPKSGSIYFTADLVDDDVRETPVSIRLVRQELIGEDENEAKIYKDAETVSEVASKLYPQGIVETYAEIDQDGRYELHLLIGGEDVIAEEDILRIPFNIGVDPDAKSMLDRILITLAIILAILTPIIMGMIILSPVLPKHRWTEKLIKLNIFQPYRRNVESHK